MCTELFVFIWTIRTIRTIRTIQTVRTTQVVEKEEGGGTGWIFQNSNIGGRSGNGKFDNRVSFHE